MRLGIIPSFSDTDSNKVTDMLIAILNCCSKEELEDESDEEILDETGVEMDGEGPDRRKVIKNKILAVGRMARVFALLRSVHQFAEYIFV